MSYLVPGTPADAPHILAPDWFGSLFTAWWSLQYMQWQALSSWQAATAACQQELLDVWAVHWAGGAPID